jgi:hypothetical protein
MTEHALRLVAGTVGAVIVAWPNVASAATWLTSKKTVTPQDDAVAVVGIARRLQAAGNKSGVSLCQQLLAVLLEADKR